MRAISAPRSQRAAISLRVTSPSSRMPWSRATRRRIDPPGATVRIDQRMACHGLAQSTSFDVRLATWSSAPNSAAMRSALAEHPASLSSSA